MNTAPTVAVESTFVRQGGLFAFGTGMQRYELMSHLFTSPLDSFWLASGIPYQADFGVIIFFFNYLLSGLHLSSGLCVCVLNLSADHASTLRN